ncbi:MAG: hypothetical protein QOJ07_3555, partial [Thermoleophilaceae bacterium]|nr:hypothetical protein [Thermoleophilaceae bacterium]
RAVGRAKAAAAIGAARLGWRGADERIDSWRAARAYARGYADGVRRAGARA